MFEKVKDIIVDQLFLTKEEADQITMETRIMLELRADSLDMVEIVLMIEDEFDCEISDEDFERCITVGDFVKLVEEL